MWSRLLARCWWRVPTVVTLKTWSRTHFGPQNRIPNRLPDRLLPDRLLPHRFRFLSERCLTERFLFLFPPWLLPTPPREWGWGECECYGAVPTPQRKWKLRGREFRGAVVISSVSCCLSPPGVVPGSLGGVAFMRKTARFNVISW